MEAHTSDVYTGGVESDPDFAGDWTPLPQMAIPSPEQLPPAAYSIISRRLGLDLQDEDLETAKRLAANEWFWRNAKGHKVTFEQVMRGGSLANLVDADGVPITGQALAAAEQAPDPTPTSPQLSGGG